MLGHCPLNIYCLLIEYAEIEAGSGQYKVESVFHLLFLLQDFLSCLMFLLCEPLIVSDGYFNGPHLLNE